MTRIKLPVFAIVGMMGIASLTPFTSEAQQEQNRDKDKEKRVDREYQSDRNLDRAQDRDRDKDREQDRDADRDRDRDREHFNDGMGGVIFGAQQMTEQERASYRQRIKTAASEQQRMQIRAEHQKQIEAQMLNSPLLSDEAGGFIYGGYQMTEQERQRYRQMLKSAGSEQERKQIRAEHQKQIHMQAQNKALFDDEAGGFIYGGDQITEQERQAYRQMIKSATSEQQRNKIRMEHQEKMQKRLSEKMQQDLSEDS
ncbi:hypothetical protein [Brumicola nitratireducens]|uniref:Uncharacterized protein n=1 Tax=Glaciecola nitratireducens (strain JCM 12485 / KCTC 12276 / FR1064) TaxID=1085623 RepID=G4QKL6_GLANF|nr:hypothetical protein [Glaciecola nitratireducens]AEP30082.1 hypothetical protein GNIT_1973 [Glaciecola nitratireducens FR1064]